MNKLSLVLFSVLSLIYPQTVLAQDDHKGKHKGPEVSAEHKSEQGLEHGKAYTGTKEKEEKDVKEGKVKKDKKEK